MPDVPVWGPPYPGPSEIRADVDAMVDSVAGSLLDRFGDAIAGLWFMSVLGTSLTADLAQHR